MTVEELRQERCRLYMTMWAVRDSNGCLIWQGNLSKTTGYASMHFFSRGYTVHRFIALSLLLHTDEERKAHEHLQVCHTCDVRSCIEPTHLFFGTIADNIHDMVKKERHYRPTGVLNVYAKLTEEQVIEIRSIHNTSPRRSLSSIAREFNISPPTISDVIYRRTWTHV